MKYTVEGFNQKALVKFGLNGIDSIILRYVVDFWHSSKMVKVVNKEDNKEYLWIKYKAVIEALPCIEIKSKIALAKRFKKYVACGLMEHYHHKQGGSFSCYRFTEKYDRLTQNIEGVIPERQTPSIPQVKPKNSSINDESIKEYKEIATRVLLFLNKKTGKKFKPVNGSLKNIIARLKEGNTEEDCKQVIDTMCHNWKYQPKMQQYLTYVTLFRPTKFPIYLNAEKIRHRVPVEVDGKTKWYWEDELEGVEG